MTLFNNNEFCIEDGRVVVIYGPPGTGKTTTLVKVVESVKKGKTCGILSFSRAAAKEIAGRTKKASYVGTIHSLCFNLGGYHHNQVVDRDDFINWLKLDEEMINAVLGLYEYARNCLVEIEKISEIKHQVGDGTVLSVPEETFVYIIESYAKWKDNYGYIDFTDMLINHQEDYYFDVLIIDEAQDLSPLQWKIIKSLEYKTLVIAGDDDQAIYEWMGASPKEMYSLGTEDHVLNQSYRLPKKVHKFACALADYIKVRKEKKYLPTDKEGDLIISEMLPPWIEKDSIILVRDNYTAELIQGILTNMGVPHKPGILTSKWRKVINNYRDKKFDKIDDNYFLDGVNPDQVPWNVGLKVPLYVSAFFMFLEEKFGFIPKPMVEVSTIHKSKGKEWNYVYLYGRLIGKSEENLARDLDAELRVWYVGATRALNTLHIVAPNQLLLAAINDYQKE